MFDENVLSLPGARGAVGACGAFGVVAALCVVGEAVGLARAIAGLWAGAGLTSQVGWIALFLCCFSARRFVVFWRDGRMDRFAEEACTALRSRALEKLYALGPSYVAAHGSGATTTTLVDGIVQVRDYLALIVPKVAELVTVPTVLGVALLVLDPMSGVICIVLVPVTVFFMQLLGSYSKENAARQFAAYRRMSNQFADTLAGLSTLERFGAAKRHGARVFAASERLREATVGTLRTATLSSLVLDLIRVFALAAVAIMLGFRLMAGEVMLAPALAVLVIVPEFFAAIRRYASDFHASLDGREQLAAILEIAEAPAEEIASAPPSEEDDERGRLLCRIEAKDVRFGYRGDGGAESFHLSGISFSASAPMKVGIVGASGSGKSTLARLLTGFASPASGSLAVNGVESPTLACPAWRGRVAYLPQDPHVFSATLRDNVAFYRPQADDAQVLGALRRAGLGEFIDGLPDGLDTQIGQGGRALSGGQAQRVALARALLDGRRDVLVLDEPTAHLDIETELALKTDITAAMEGKLVFFATHRLHWMREMDLVLVLEDGRLVESGAPGELLARDGAFARLVAALRGDAR